MNTIKAVRQLLDLSQAELGTVLGVTQGNVSFYEKGQTVPPPVAAKLIEFARSKGVPLTFDEVYAEHLPAAAPAPESAQV